MTTPRDNISPDKNSPDFSAEHLSPSEQRELARVWNLPDFDSMETPFSMEPCDPGLKASVRSSVLNAIAESPSVRSPQIGNNVRFLDRLIINRSTSSTGRIVRLGWSYSVAAVLIALVSFSFLLAPEIHVISAPHGSVEPVRFTLPDATSGFLSAGSELRYSNTFGNSGRVVALKGEATFDVTKNGSTFFVDTYNTRVEVLGTSFSIRSWPSDTEPETIIRVQEGLVGVSNRYNSGNSVELSPSEQIRVTVTPVIAASVESMDQNSFLWTTGGIDFVNMPIGNVLSELSRRFDVSLEAPLVIRSRRITLLPAANASLENVIIDMTAAANLRYRKIAGGYEIYQD